MISLVGYPGWASMPSFFLYGLLQEKIPLKKLAPKVARNLRHKCSRFTYFQNDNMSLAITL